MRLTIDLFAFVLAPTITQLAPEAVPESVPASAEQCDANNVMACEAQCDAGKASTCSDLAELYLMGRGVPENAARAVQLYEKACHGGLAAACFSVASVYESGQGVPKNVKSAAEAYRRGCAAGDRAACQEHRRLIDGAVHTPTTPSTGNTRPAGSSPDDPSQDAGRTMSQGGQQDRMVDDCDRPRERNAGLDDCNTPRPGVLSGVYAGLEFGLAAIRSEAKTREGVGSGRAFHLRVGVAFWDHLLLGAGFGSFFFDDDAPFTELVVDCTQIGSADPICDEGYRPAQSTISGTFVTAETGFQYRLRPGSAISVVPGVAGGYLHTFGGLERGIGGCKDCLSLPLHVDAAGFYCAPFLRLTFGTMGNYAALVQSRVFLTSDLGHFSSLGFEVGLP